MSAANCCNTSRNVAAARNVRAVLLSARPARSMRSAAAKTFNANAVCRLSTRQDKRNTHRAVSLTSGVFRVVEHRAGPFECGFVAFEAHHQRFEHRSTFRCDFDQRDCLLHSVNTAYPDPQRVSSERPSNARRNVCERARQSTKTVSTQLQ